MFWPVWPNGWVLSYEQNGSGFESSCSLVNFRFSACFKTVVPWNSDNYRVYIHSKRVLDMTRGYSHMHRTGKYSEHNSIIWSVWPNGWVFVYYLSDCMFQSSCSHLNFTLRACFKQRVRWQRATTECGFTLKRVHDMARTYSEMHRTDKYSEQCSITWPISPNVFLFVYELSGSGFQSSCNVLNFKFRASFKQGFPWHLGNGRLWIPSEARTLYDQNIQSNALYR